MNFDHDNFRRGERLEITVGGGRSGERLDSYLCSRFSHLSRAKMQRIIRAQGVQVNGRPGKPSRRLYNGDVVAFDLPDTELLAEDIPLDILYEDDDMIVLNKQPGLLVHPARGNSSGTILNGLAHYAAGQYTPDVVHRLDRNTSGVLVVSKNQQANMLLSQQFVDRSVEKSYIAIVHAVIHPPEGKIELPVDAADDGSEKYIVSDAGKYALTFYKTLKVSGDKNYSLLEVDIKTGRTHQIRVHLASVGCPIVADVLYGGSELKDKDATIIGRCALHSRRLRLRRPRDGREMEFVAPLGDDIARADKFLFDLS
jgi:23S rRNA pseudouridine1911/1915/1917 synthase